MKARLMKARKYLFILAALLLLPSTAWPQNQPPNTQPEDIYLPIFRLRLSVTHSTFDGSTTSTYANQTYPSLDWEKQLALPTKHLFPQIEMGIYPIPPFELYLSGLILQLKGHQELENPLSWREKTFSQNESLNSLQQIYLFQLGYYLHLIQASEGSAAIGLGAAYLKMTTKLETKQNGYTSDTIDGLLPLLKLKGELRLKGFLFLYGKLDVGAIFLDPNDHHSGNDEEDDEDQDGEAENSTPHKNKTLAYVEAEIGIKIALVPELDLYLGYRLHRFYAKEELGNALQERQEATFSGFVFSVEFKF